MHIHERSRSRVRSRGRRSVRRLEQITGAGFDIFALPLPSALLSPIARGGSVADKNLMLVKSPDGLTREEIILRGAHQAFRESLVWATLGRAQDHRTRYEGSPKLDPTLSIHSEGKIAGRLRLCAGCQVAARQGCSGPGDL